MGCRILFPKRVLAIDFRCGIYGLSQPFGVAVIAREFADYLATSGSSASRRRAAKRQKRLHVLGVFPEHKILISASKEAKPDNELNATPRNDFTILFVLHGPPETQEDKDQRIT